MKPLLKICGIKHNIAEVATLRPDYLGFIFYEKSPRFFANKTIPQIPKEIKKVGVFVDAEIDFVITLTRKHSLDVIQLHGEESKVYVHDLHEYLALFKLNVLVWKVFSVGETFDFSQLKDFETKVHAFLFDTKGSGKGGNGYAFNWEILRNYPSKKPFILSGGIGHEEIDAMKMLLKSGLPILAIDVNSKFETEPGRKDVSSLKKFMGEILRK